MDPFLWGDGFRNVDFNVFQILQVIYYELFEFLAQKETDEYVGIYSESLHFFGH